jgi:hypothetical protein
MTLKFTSTTTCYLKACGSPSFQECISIALFNSNTPIFGDEHEILHIYDTVA